MNSIQDIILAQHIAKCALIYAKKYLAWHKSLVEYLTLLNDVLARIKTGSFIKEE